MATSTKQAVALVEVYDYLLNPGDAALTTSPGLSGRRVKVTLAYDKARSIAPVTWLENLTVYSTLTDQNGFWHVFVAPTDNINPSGTYYIVEVEGYLSYKINPTLAGVPGVGWQSSAILLDIPASLTQAGQTITGPLTVTGLLSVTAGEPGIDTITPGALLLGDNIATSIELGAPTTNAITLQLAGKPWFDVTHPAYGAKGDGVTNDGPAIRAAIAAAVAAGGGVVYFPPGTYLCLPTSGGNPALPITGNAVVLLGAGRNLSHIKAGTGSDSLINCVNFSPFACCDLDLDGNLISNKIVAVSSSGGTVMKDIVVQRCRIRNNAVAANGWAVIIWDTQQASVFGGVISRVRFLDNIVEDCVSTVIDQVAWAYCTDVLVSGNTFNNLGRVAFSFFCRDIRTVNNHFGVFLNTASGAFSSQNEACVGNTFDNCTQPVNIDQATNMSFIGNILNNVSLHLGSFTANVDLKIIGNVINGGVIEGGANPSTRVSVIGNTVIGNNEDHTINFTPGTLELIIADNEIASIATVALIAIHVQSDYAIVRGNKIRDGRGGSATISVGIKLDAANRCLIEGNTVRDTAAAGWFVEAGASNNNMVINNIQSGAGGAVVVGAATLLWNNQGDESHSVGTLTGGALTLLKDFTFGGHLVSTASGTPTTSNLGANVTSVTFTGNDTRGTIAIVMSAGLAANTRVATCTFAVSYGATGPKITLVDQTSTAGLAIVNSYVLAQATGVSFDIAFDQALVAGTYTIDYIVIG